MEESTNKRWEGLRESARTQLEIRDYSQRPVRASDYLDADHPASIDIPGVELIARQIHQQQHRGFFGEFAREGEVPFWPRQWATARMFRDTAKGFHIHPPHIPDGEEAESWFQKLFGDPSAAPAMRPYAEEQWDLMFFIQGIAEIILIDERSGLPRRQLRVIIDGDDRPGSNNAAIIIPPGVAHAIRSASSTDLIMVYGTSTTFEPQNEGRIASGIESAALPPDWTAYMER
jgi:dTDP-4-dehydrorhamnose 3,5-epimerase-like enzyme